MMTLTQKMIIVLSIFLLKLCFDMRYVHSFGKTTMNLLPSLFPISRVIHTGADKMRRKSSLYVQNSSPSSSVSTVTEPNISVDRILSTISNEKGLEENDKDKKIGEIMDYLESISKNEDNDVSEEVDTEYGSLDRFTPILGNYDVSHVALPSSKKKKKKNNSPAGGKWTRKGGLAQLIFQERRKFQHLLQTNKTNSSLVRAAIDEGKYNLTITTDQTYPVVAEAVNIVSLDALFGLLRLTVILKGDVVPLTSSERVSISQERRTPGGLSKYAVRAFFDRPRIVLGKRGKIFNIRLGPTSCVVLDTTYSDSKVRIGKGSFGSRFFFQRCANSDEEANEWVQLYEQKPIRKRTALIVLSCIGGVGISITRMKGQRALDTAVSIVSSLMLALVASSSGGIEEDATSAK